MQSHSCAYLQGAGDQYRCDEHCQYKLTTADEPLGPVFCGKDQILRLQSEEIDTGVQ
jgi:hypothetical protein